MCSLPKSTAEFEAQDKSLMWKIKGIVAKISFRMFSKYADPGRYTPKDDPENIIPFATSFSQKYSIPLLESHL